MTKLIWRKLGNDEYVAQGDVWCLVNVDPNIPFSGSLNAGTMKIEMWPVPVSTATVTVGTLYKDIAGLGGSRMYELWRFVGFEQSFGVEIKTERERNIQPDL